MNVLISKEDRENISRAQTIVAILEENAAKYADKPPFKAAVDKVIENLRIVEKAAQDLEKPTQGDTIVKDVEKYDLAEYVASKCKILVSFAKTTDQEEIIPIIDFSKTSLNIMSQTILPGIINNIVEVINANLPALADYEINATTVETINTLLAAFVASRHKVKVNVITKQTLHKQFKTRLENLNNRIDILQGLTEIFETTEHTFYILLTEAYSHRKPVYGFVSVRGYVNNTDNTIPLYQVNVTLSAIGFDTQQTQTTDFGYFQFKNIKKGLYNIIFNRIGKLDKSQTIEVFDNKHTELLINMEDL